MAETFGYSGKPLIAKLGLKPGERLLALDAPDHYAALVEPLPEGAILSLKPFDEAVRGADIVHAFFRTRAELDASAARLIALPGAGGMIWVSWPKKSSSLYRDLTEGGFRDVLLPTGWVDVKVAAVDADWSGLKFLRRRT
jgi:hypothetical protein